MRFALCLLLAPLIAPLRAQRVDLAERKFRVQVLNLLNGLELTEEQRTTIARLAREAERLRERERAEASALEMQYAELLDELSMCLMDGRDPGPPLVRTIHECKSRLEELKLDTKHGLDSLAGEVLKVLQPHQIYTLEHFVPCLFPPSESRAGQAQGGSGLVKHMERIYHMPEPVYRMRESAIVSRILEKEELHYPPGLTFEREKEEAFVRNFLRDMRAMDPVAFELDKEKLAQSFIERNKPSHPGADGLSRAKRFLLSPITASLLESMCLSPISDAGDD